MEVELTVKGPTMLLNFVQLFELLRTMFILLHYEMIKFFVKNNFIIYNNNNNNNNNLYFIIIIIIYNNINNL